MALQKKQPQQPIAVPLGVVAANIKILPFSEDDWPKIARIYAEGIATKMATFETTIPSWNTWHQAHLVQCRLKAVYKDQIMGWVALAPISKRKVYCGVAEVSVYVAANARGKGIGYALLKKLIEYSETHGFWTLQASIFSENLASIALHKKAGFRVLGIRKKIGKIGTVWKDNTLMERRSAIVGI